MQGKVHYMPTDVADYNLQKAFDCLLKAVEIEPGLAEAHAWLAHFYLELGGDKLENEKVVFPKAWQAVEKALGIDQNLAMAYSTRGFLKFAMNWDFDGAERDLKRALELAPGDTVIPQFYASFLCFSGRGDEAISLIKNRAEKLKPIGLENLYAGRQSLHYLWTGRYDEALGELKKFPTGEWRWNSAAVKALKGVHAEALDLMNEYKDQAGYKDDPWFRRDRAWILAIAGRRQEALEALNAHTAILARKNVDTAFDKACVYAGLGDKDKAFELLYKSYKNHSGHITMLVAEWCLHSLHGDPRFDELARKIGFPLTPRSKKN